MSSTPHYQLIDQPAQLPPLFAALDRATEIALDTEADNLFRYKTQVCLLQILAAGEIYLVDLLAGLPLGELWPRLAAKPLIMHGSDYDLRLLRELCDFRPHSIFDTMFAAQLLSIPRFGLASLLEQHFGVQLDKDNQKANWSKRPLERDMLDYAALDVFHLPALRDKLRDELARQDRIKAERDRLARELNLDPTLLATRSQLALMARDPAGIDAVLLPWQAALFRSNPVWTS